MLKSEFSLFNMKIVIEVIERGDLMFEKEKLNLSLKGVKRFIKKSLLLLIQKEVSFILEWMTLVIQLE